MSTLDLMFDEAVSALWVAVQVFTFLAVLLYTLLRVHGVSIPATLGCIVLWGAAAWQIVMIFGFWFFLLRWIFLLIFP